MIKIQKMWLGGVLDGSYTGLQEQKDLDDKFKNIVVTIFWSLRSVFKGLRVSIEGDYYEKKKVF